MALYLITYDINEKNAFDYEALWKQLRELGAVMILPSGWAVKSEAGSAGSLFSNLARHIQEKDRMLVQEITADASWEKLMVKDDRFYELLESAKS